MRSPGRGDRRPDPNTIHKNPAGESGQKITIKTIQSLQSENR